MKVSIVFVAVVQSVRIIRSHAEVKIAANNELRTWYIPSVDFDKEVPVGARITGTTWEVIKTKLLIGEFY